MIVKTDKQLLTYASISAAVIILAGIIFFSGTSTGFNRYIGRTNPLAAISIIALLGAFFLHSLGKRVWFPLDQSGRRRRTAVYCAAALIFALPTILVDCISPYPADVNVLFPESAAFYPVMGFAVEVLFHLVPLLLVMIILTSIFGSRHNPRLAGAGIHIAALAEPLFHVISETGSGYPPWKTAYVGVHNYLFNVFQLYVFKRSGFPAMYLVRLSYYLLWHVVWGEIRLDLLF